MQSFIEKQFKKEQKYIWNKHLGGGIFLTSDLKQIENTHVQMCDAKFLRKKYKVYKDPVEGVTLIPADLTDFSDDFGPIIKYGQTTYGQLGFTFISMERTNATVTTRTYTFTTMMSSDNMPQVLCQFATFADENNDLQKAFLQSGKTLAHFVAGNNHLSAVHDPNQYTVKVRRDKTKTNWNAGVYNLQSMTKERLDEYFTFPYDAADNKTSMIKLAETIYQNELEKQDSKQKQKA